MAALIRSTSLPNRFIQLVIAAVGFLGLIWFLQAADVSLPLELRLPHFSSHVRPPSPTQTQFTRDHPIDLLIAGASLEFDAILSRETETLHDAAQAYQERRGRNPPPGFDLWFEFTRNHSAIVVEEFWDQIYHDLNPFWGVSAKQMREQANSFLHRISVRDGNATFRTDEGDRPWMKLWTELTNSIAPLLPDMDLAINVMDESRLVVPWEEIDGYMETERKRKRIVPEYRLKDKFEKLTLFDQEEHPPFSADWDTSGPYWTKAVLGCHPDSEAREAPLETDFSTPPPLNRTFPVGSYLGYVKNFTLAQSPCDNPQFQSLHGSFVEPVSLSLSTKLFPLFGGSKLPMNNEILLPAAMYWTDDPFYSGGKSHGKSWERKKDALIWRGAASGGRNTKNNWTRFQRHRFLSMINATSVLEAEKNPDEDPPNFLLPDPPFYDLSGRSKSFQPGDLSKWVDTWSDAAFVHLLCHPKAPSKGLCPYSDPYFHIKDSIPMKDQYDYKYLPDVDGNSFSGRYRGFLGSTSMPIKATIYKEWHDSRLVPWRHFVPMDNTFIDIYGIMEYFLGNKLKCIPGHDAAAEKIALGGKEWAEKVLRREDMQIYVFRLFLEYARLCDDDRELMGWREGGVPDSGSNDVTQAAEGSEVTQGTQSGGDDGNTAGAADAGITVGTQDAGAVQGT